MPFDVVHAHTPFLAGRAARRIARRRRIPLVATFHSKYYEDFYRVTHSRRLSLWALKYVVSFYNTCDEVWAVNDKTADVLRQYGYRGPIITMPNGTDPQSVSDETYRRVLARWSLRDGVSTLLFVGQMDFKKNPHLILRACALLRERLGAVMRPDAHAGAGGYEVRSLYFDDMYGSAYGDKSAGLLRREKFRLRI